MRDDKEPPSEEVAASDDLSARVKKAILASAPRKERGLNEAGAYGMAMRLVAELVSGPVVGLLIGWGLDKALGTKPWMVIGFVFLGLGAGIFNVMRAARQIEEVAARQREEAEKAENKEGN